MPNNISSNYTLTLSKAFLPAFESGRVVTKTVDTQMISEIGANNGGEVAVNRPHDYLAYRSADGDISSSGKSNIIAGKATAVVQPYITVAAEWSDFEQALQLGDKAKLAKILKPMATRAVTELETSLAAFMRKQGNLSIGSPGTAVDAWADIAGAGSLLHATGVPMDDTCYYVADPYSVQNLAGVQQGLNNGKDSLIDTAWEKSQVSNNVGGLQVIASNALSAFTSGTASDRAGALNGVPTATYVAHKDSMIQSIAVDGFSGTQTIKAGEIVEITGKYRLNQSTREMALGADGLGIKWRGTVTADVALAAGAGTLLVAGPAIFEAAGQYNTVNAALADGDVITILGAASTVYQPNLFYKKEAFGLATAELSKLFSTDTQFQTEDGISIRCCKYADGDSNKQMVRFDVLPAFAVFSPFMAGLGYGIA